MSRLASAGKPVDMLTLMISLREGGLLAEIGDVGYLNEMEQSVPSTANLPAYLGELRDKHRLRKFATLLGELQGKISGAHESVDAFIASSALDLVTIADDQVEATESHIKQSVRKVVDDMEEHYTRGKLNIPPGYLPTGFDYMDKVQGGIAPEDLFILAGRPGSGKTTLVSDIVWNLNNTAKWMSKTGGRDADGRDEWVTNTGNCPVGIFSLEMSSKSLARRLMFRSAQVSAGKFKQGFASADDFQKLTVASAAVSKCNITIDDEPGQTIGQIAAKARRWVRKYGIKLFVLDYLQLVKADKKGENRNRELEDVVNTLIVLKKSLKVPWIVLAQMNRDIEKSESSRVPQLADLKDCGAIEQACDHAFFLYIPDRGKVKFKDGEEKLDERAREERWLEEYHSAMEHTERPRRVNGFEAKNRDGATGEVSFIFHKNQFRFEDWRQFATANGFDKYGKGERASANPLEQDEL
jgi:replicative DNA helicase